MSSKKSGFTPPNYTQTPNTLFDLLPVLSNAELRITMALVRETFGWHRQRTEQISQTELAALAGLSESSAKTGLAEGLKRGTLKRHKTKDNKNRPTYRYSIVISNADAVVFEEFERPKAKPTVLAIQDSIKLGLPGQNLTGLDFDWVKFRPGQNLTPSPVNLMGQNLTPSYKEQRNILEVKKVVEDTGSKEATQTASERNDEGQVLEKINPIPEEEVIAEAGPQSTAQPHDQEGVFHVQENHVASTHGNSTRAGEEDVPGAAARPDWTEAEVNARLHQLLNRRWLNPWRKKGETEFQPPLIDEPDQGHDRHQIARRISPDRLEELANEARLERNELELKARKEPHIVLLTHQHLLLRRLTHELIRLEQLDQQVKASRALPSPVIADSTAEGLPVRPVAKQEAPRADFGSMYLGLWELKANPSQVVDVVDVEDRPGSTPLLRLKTEGTLTVTDITLKYRRPTYAAD